MDPEFLKQLLKGTGHGGNWFVGLFLAFLLAVPPVWLVIAFWQNSLSSSNPTAQTLAWVLTALSVLLLALSCAGLVRRSRVWRRNKLDNSRLSSDELVKARSKLKSGAIKAPQVAAPNRPDTDLKY